MTMHPLRPSGRASVTLSWTKPAAADLDALETYIATDNSPAVAIDVVPFYFVGT